MKRNNRTGLIIVFISGIILALVIFLLIDMFLSSLLRKLYVTGIGLYAVTGLVSLYIAGNKQQERSEKSDTALLKLFLQTRDLLQKSITCVSETRSFLNSLYPEKYGVTIKEKKYNVHIADEEPDIYSKIGVLSEIITSFINDPDYYSGIDVVRNQDKKSNKKNSSCISFLHMYFSAEIINSFIISIISNLNKTSEPLSKSIFDIKKKLNDFLKDISGWNDAFTKEGSDKNFSAIINTYTTQNKEFKNIVTGINQSYNVLDNNLNVINQNVVKIGHITEIITDISEKIHILSINASIESARAGKSGKGFKIVAGEVKKLSGNTQNSVTEIVPITHEAYQIVLDTLDQFNNGRSDIIQMIEKQNQEFNSFYKMLNSYYTEITNMLKTTSEVIVEIHNYIDKLIPIFQESNLTIQELENLNRMVKGFISVYQNDLKGIITTIPKEQIDEMARTILRDIKKETTTEAELQVIYEIARKFQIENEIKQERKETDIELF